MEILGQVGYYLLLLALLVVILMGVYLTIVYLVKKHVVEKELKEILRMCREIDAGVQKGIAAFNPPPGERGYYEVLVERGLMKRNPLGGYSLSSSQDSTWGKIPDSFYGVGKEYKDDDGVMQMYKYGKTEIKITEDMIEEYDIDEMKAAIFIDRFFKSLGLEK